MCNHSFCMESQHWKSSVRHSGGSMGFLRGFYRILYRIILDSLLGSVGETTEFGSSLWTLWCPEHLFESRTGEFQCDGTREPTCQAPFVVTPYTLSFSFELSIGFSTGCSIGFSTGFSKAFSISLLDSLWDS